MDVIFIIVLGVVGLAAGVWVFRHFRAVSRGDWQPPEGARAPWWLPGQGGHGSGAGQAPPWVPYHPDWEPKNRIR